MGVCYVFQFLSPWGRLVGWLVGCLAPGILQSWHSRRRGHSTPEAKCKRRGAGEEESEGAGKSFGVVIVFVIKRVFGVTTLLWETQTKDNSGELALCGSGRFRSKHRG